jgi:antitoxin ParD1/3/4
MTTETDTRKRQDQETRLAALDASIMRGIADADAGRTHAADDVFSELRARYQAMLPSEGE